MDEKKQLGEIVDRHREILRERLAEEAMEEQRLKKERAQQEREEGEVLAKLLASGRVSHRASPSIVGFKRLNDDATVPTKAHTSDSGFDLYAAEDIVIEPGETVIVPTGIAVQLPEGMEAQVRPRSGVTAKTKLRVHLGTIDNGYSGEIGVIVDCIGSVMNDDGSIAMKYGNIDGSISDISIEGRYGSYLIRRGDRIAQLVVQALPSVEAIEIETLSETDRGEGGFGSSGV